MRLSPWSENTGVEWSRKLLSGQEGYIDQHCKLTG